MSSGPSTGHTVRVAVLGDAQTGKSSLISSAANDTFDARPPPVLPPVRLPRDFSPDGVPMLVTDTSSRPEDAAATELAVLHADVVVVCFDAQRLSSLDSVRSVWYPRVQRAKPDVPVILACCKSDLLQDPQDGQEIQAIREVGAIVLHMTNREQVGIIDTGPVPAQQCWKACAWWTRMATKHIMWAPCMSAACTCAPTGVSLNSTCMRFAGTVLCWQVLWAGLR